MAALGLQLAATLSIASDHVTAGSLWPGHVHSIFHLLCHVAAQSALLLTVQEAVDQRYLPQHVAAKLPTVSGARQVASHVRNTHVAPANILEVADSRQALAATALQFLPALLELALEGDLQGVWQQQGQQ